MCVRALGTVAWHSRAAKLASAECVCMTIGLLQHAHTCCLYSYIDVQNQITSKKLKPRRLKAIRGELPVRKTKARIDFSFGDPAASFQPAYANKKRQLTFTEGSANLQMNWSHPVQRAGRASAEMFGSGGRPRTAVARRSLHVGATGEPLQLNLSFHRADKQQFPQSPGPPLSKFT